VTDSNKHLLTAGQIQAITKLGGHPWNPKSEFNSAQLSRSLGMERAMVALVTLAPNKESFVPHTHEREEEWIYILSGTGTALLDEDEVLVGPGDFMGFTTPSVVHHLRNTGTQDLVYLMGGECRFAEASNFPTLGKRKIRYGNEVQVLDLPKDSGEKSS